MAWLLLQDTGAAAREKPAEKAPEIPVSVPQPTGRTGTAWVFEGGLDDLMFSAGAADALLRAGHVPEVVVGSGLPGIVAAMVCGNDALGFHRSFERLRSQRFLMYAVLDELGPAGRLATSAEAMDSIARSVLDRGDAPCTLLIAGPHDFLECDGPGDRVRMEELVGAAVAARRQPSPLHVRVEEALAHRGIERAVLLAPHKQHAASAPRGRREEFEWLQPDVAQETASRPLLLLPGLGAIDRVLARGRRAGSAIAAQLSLAMKESSAQGAAASGAASAAGASPAASPASSAGASGPVRSLYDSTIDR